MAILRSSYAQVAGDTVPTYLQALQKPLQRTSKNIDNIGTRTTKDNLDNTITSVRMKPEPSGVDCFGQKLDLTHGWPSLVPESGTNSPFWHTVIDNEASFQWFLEDMNFVEELAVELFMDVEGGNDHGRNGNLNLIQILRASTKRLWLLDVKAIGVLPFYVKYHTGKQQSIANILGNPNIPIIVFDSRSDSDSLNANLSIRLRGVIDLQLMEAVTRKTNRKFLCGLDKCVVTLMQKSKIEWWAWHVWNVYKTRGKRACSGPTGYGRFDERPLPRVLENYALNDLIYMPTLFSFFSEEGGICRDENLMRQVIRLSEERVKASTSLEGNTGDCRHNPQELWQSD